MSKGGSGTDFMSLLATFASATDQSTKSTKKIKVVSRGQTEVFGSASSKVNARPGGNLCGNPPKKIKVVSRGQTKVVGTASSKVNALPGGNPSDYYGPNRSTNTSTLKVVSRGTIDIDIDINTASSKFGSVSSGGNQSQARAINKRMAGMGYGDWRGLLAVHQHERGMFDKVSWATAASRLGRLRMREMGDMKRDARVSESEEC